MNRARQWQRWFGRGPILLAALAVCQSTLAQDELESRRTRVDQLSATEKKELLAKKDRFDKLSPDEQRRIRNLHDQLSRDGQSERLQQVLQNYSTWLSTLSQNDRSELLDVADAAQRLSRIRELKHREEDRWLSELGLNSNDVDGILDWFDAMLKSHQEELQKRFPTDPAHAPTFTERNRGRHQLYGRMLSREGMKDFLEIVPPDEITPLLSKLSNTATDRYASLDTEKKHELLANWIRRAAWSRFKPPPISDKQLDRMISELPAEERQKLERLPRERVYEELRKRFELSRGFSRARRGNGGRPDGRRREGPPPAFPGDASPFPRPTGADNAGPDDDRARNGENDDRRDAAGRDGDGRRGDRRNRNRDDDENDQDRHQSP